MNRHLLSFLTYIALCLSLASCKSKSAAVESTSANTTPEMSLRELGPDELSKIQENIAKGRLGDSTSFPYVYQGEGRSLIFQAYTMSFTLTPQPALIGMINSMVPWAKPDLNNINNGLFITYVRNGRPLSLDQPYIQVQYINKALPYCSTVDSIFFWLDENFLVNSDAHLLRKRSVVKTASGLSAEIQDYFTGTSSQPGVRSKWVSNAYIDHDKDYLVGFGLSTMSKDDYDLTKPLLEDLIESFQFY